MHLLYLVNAIPDESDNVPLTDPHNSGTLPGGVELGESPYELAGPAAFGLYIVLRCSLSRYAGSFVQDPGYTMNILDVVFLALGAISVYTAWTKVRAWHNLRHIPGPSWARWSHIWLVKQIFAGIYVDRLQELHAKHGPVVLLSPDMVAVGDPRAIREISNPRLAWGRGPLYLGFRTAPGEDSLFSQPDRKAHEVLRKKLVGGYSGKSIGLGQVHAMIDERVLKLIELISSKYVASVNGDQTFDLSRVLKYFTTDTISSFAFQRCFGCLDRDGDFHNYLQMTSKIAPPMVAMCTLPLFQKLQDTPSMKPFLPKGGFLKPILDIAREVVAERFGEEMVDRDDDVLGVWIANGLTQREAEVETVGQLAVCLKSVVMLV